MAPSVIGYFWNAGAGRFVTAGGRFLAFSEVRRALDVALDGAGQDARAIAAQFSSGLIGVSEFERQMQRLVKDTQLYSSAVAAGGFSQLGGAELSLLESRIAEQFRYLSNLSDDLAAGAKISPAQLAARSNLYAQSARNTYDVTYRAAQLARGYDEERNVTHPGEHCEECLQESARGWVATGTLKPVGQRTCLGNCNCTIEYRRSA